MWYRVRDIFRRGASKAPCIIFIDELDALAKTRGAVKLKKTHVDYLSEYRLGT